MGLTGVQRAISSAGLPGADDVGVDCKIFFRCCCWFSKYSFTDVVVVVRCKVFLVGCKVFLELGDFFLSTSLLPGVDLNRPHRLQGW